MGAVQSLLEVKGVAMMAPEVKNWDVSSNPRATAPALELASLLGPFLRLTTFPDSFVRYVSSLSTLHELTPALPARHRQGLLP